MEGFVKIRLKPWLRRLVTRLAVVFPAVLVIVLQGESAVDNLIIISQVIISFQLGFAVIPLVLFTGDVDIMGPAMVDSWWVRVVAWVMTVFVTIANMALLYDAMRSVF